MTILLDGSSLNTEKLVQIARHNKKIEIDQESIDRIKLSRKILEDKLKSGEVIYGVNTGIGNFSEGVLNDRQIDEFQINLIHSHAAGIGDPAPVELVRAAMAARINVHVQGYSACRPEIILTLVEMLNKGVTPVVCLKGSVGACGDLAPMSQIALLLIGEGEAFYQGERLPGKVAFDRAGITLPGIKARDGLAVINGSNFLTAASAIQVFDINRFLRHAEIAAAMALEALESNIVPFDARLHELRGFAGSIRSANAIMACLKGGDLFAGKIKTKNQDAYSLRSTPQIIGSAHDAVSFAKKQIEIELNGIGDNPILLPDEKLTLTGANFQSMPVTLPMEMVGIALTAVCVLSERRLNRLLNPSLSMGLPPFLVKNPGLNSGMMLSQYTADTLIVEQRILSAPASNGSIPAAADQEDFVSMGMNTAIKNMQILDNAYGIIGIELMCAAQALDIRGNKYGNGTEKAKKIIRKYVPHLEDDRPLYIDHNKMKSLVKSCEIILEIEKDIELLDKAKVRKSANYTEFNKNIKDKKDNKKSLIMAG